MQTAELAILNFCTELVSTLAEGKQPCLSVPRATLVDHEVELSTDFAVTRKLGNIDTSKSYVELLAVMTVIAEVVFCKKAISIMTFLYIKLMH